jgi:hypothetical protein
MTATTMMSHSVVVNFLPAASGEFMRAIYGKGREAKTSHLYVFVSIAQLLRDLICRHSMTERCKTPSMRRKTLEPAFVLWFIAALVHLGVPASGAGSRVTIDQDMVLVIDGNKVFPIGFTMPPPPDGQAPNGKNAIEELSDAGATFMRTGAWGGPWDDKFIEAEQEWQDAAARHRMHCWLFLRELGSIGPADAEKEQMLRKVIARFKDHPGMGVWKGVDEAEWGNYPVPPLVHAREIIRQLDTNHPLALTHAPRGTVASLKRYNVAADITGADLYPVGYPPGLHSLGTNKSISMVGDYTKTMMEVADGKMPVWMILQIAWSGVIKPGKTLRFPTFPEERFMAYQAIINGARGLIFFGGNLEQAWTSEDAKLRWNWSFWNRVLRPVIEEIGSKSPLYAALTAPASKLPVRLAGADNVEFCVREVGETIFLLACKREGATVQVQFTGLPLSVAGGEVLFESPRRVEVKEGKFNDWFGPLEVHVYCFRKP